MVQVATVQNRFWNVSSDCLYDSDKQWCHKYTVCKYKYKYLGGKYKYKYKYSETLRVQVQVQVLAKFTSTSTSTEFQVQVLVLPSKVYSNSSKWLALLLIFFIL